MSCAAKALRGTTIVVTSENIQLAPVVNGKNEDDFKVKNERPVYCFIPVQINRFLKTDWTRIEIP